VLTAASRLLHHLAVFGRFTAAKAIALPVFQKVRQKDTEIFTSFARFLLTITMR
jgi:hypothetical protein